MVHRVTVARRIAAGWSRADAENTPTLNASLDLAGQRFSRLTVIESAADHVEGSGKLVRQWSCRCDCGETVIVTTHRLRNGHTKSCGCYRRDLPSTTKTTHGHTRGGKPSREYNCWRSLFDRCDRPSSIVYSYYGGRGITICERWRAAFEHFLADMGPCPEGFEIDRIDPDGNYEPANCRWVSALTQANNMRSNHFICVDGVRMTVAEGARLLNVREYTLRRRAGDGLLSPDATADEIRAICARDPRRIA